MKLLDKYTPAQQAAIEAGEKAIDLSQFKKKQGSYRGNDWSLHYMDDLAQIDPVVDHPVLNPAANTDLKQRMKTEDELETDIAGFIKDMSPESEFSKAADEFTRFEKSLRLTVGKEDAEFKARTAAAPDLFRPGETNLHDEVITTPPITRTSLDRSKGAKAEVDQGFLRLMQMSGMSMNDILALRVKSLVMRHVVNQTRLGKIRKISFVSVAGNGKGLVGIGAGKSEDANEARLQSQYRAIRSMKPILRYEDRTIFGDLKGKVGATELELYTRPPGFGLRCQAYIWEICRCAGISDLAARVTRARNPMNTVKATMEALLSQKDPEEIAKARGRKLVDVRKVYYAGLV